MAENKVNYEVKIENAVVEADVKVRIDLIQEVKEMAAKSDNTADDFLVKLLEMARDNLDWKGYAKEHII